MMSKIIYLLIGFFAFTHAGAEERGSVVIAEIQKGRLTYEIDSHRAYGLDALAEELRRRYQRTGIVPQEYIAIILVSSDLTLKSIFELQGLLGKIGFTKTKTLIFHSDKQRLSELSFGNRSFPFTTAPDKLIKLVEEK
jgi:hypothetical protein